jgi:acyl-[acyl-carrier-protein]-phospholipid O-acyltransferase/long-chain-fatty-acid--[acyl-carrier-protein] ligase
VPETVARSWSSVVAEAQPGFWSASTPALWGDLPGVGALAVAVPVLLVAGLLAWCWLRPYGPLRLLLWLGTHSVYRLRLLGGEHVPARGPALLVCNPVRYLDWVLLLAAQRRFVRCVVVGGWTRRLVPRLLVRWAGAIPAEGSEGPEGVDAAFRRAGDALARGELVCVFAQDFRTPEGKVLPFRRGLEEVLRRCPGPVIPVWLAQVWGPLFRLAGGRYRWKFPQEVPYTVSVSFGPPLPASAPAADLLRALRLLSADTAVALNATRRPVHRQFVRAAARWPFRPCLADSSNPGRDLTYGRAFVAAVLLARLLRPLLGDAATTGIWLPPGTGGALANLALALLGKSSVNLNYTAPTASVQSALRQCACRHVLTARRFTARLPVDPGPGVELVYLEDLLPRVRPWHKLVALLAVVLLPGWVLDRWVLRLGRHGAQDLATVIFSSGSTGEPKGVMLSHGNVAANVESMVEAIGLDRYERILGVLPFFHSFGYAVTLWAPLQVGASAVYHPDPRQAKEIGELCRKYRCTIHLSTATFLRFCLKKCEPDDFRSLRILICGAEKLPVPLAEDFRAKFGVLPTEGYGCTELSPAAATNLPDDEVDGLVRVANRPGTVGPPLPGVAARVIHPDTRAPLPPGEEGLLLGYGANVMRGYLHKPELTREVLLDGWYMTGDMARIDEDGYVTLTGRLSRFAKTGGEMVPLEKIEEELHDILNTTDRVCAVTCVPDEARGERIVVLYVADHLAQYGAGMRWWWQELNSRGLPNLWVPSERDFFAVTELPLLGSGKVNLKRVKELAGELMSKR